MNFMLCFICMDSVELKGSELWILIIFVVFQYIFYSLLCIYVDVKLKIDLVIYLYTTCHDIKSMMIKKISDNDIIVDIKMAIMKATAIFNKNQWQWHEFYDINPWHSSQKISNNNMGVYIKSRPLILIWTSWLPWNKIHDALFHAYQW